MSDTSALERRIEILESCVITLLENTPACVNEDTIDAALRLLEPATRRIAKESLEQMRIIREQVYGK